MCPPKCKRFRHAAMPKSMWIDAATPTTKYKISTTKQLCFCLDNYAAICFVPKLSRMSRQLELESHAQYGWQSWTKLRRSYVTPCAFCVTCVTCWCLLHVTTCHCLFKSNHANISKIFHILHVLWNIVMCLVVKLFSNLIKCFFGYFDPKIYIFW